MSAGEWIDVLKALLTPLIAIVATYIAWQQWKGNQLKLRLERYNKRLRVYEEVRKILSIISRDGKANPEDLLKFRTAVSEADFLFGPEIPSYIDEIYRHGLKNLSWNQQYRDYTQEKPPEYDHKKVVDGMHNELAWLMDQFEPAKQKFRPYLDISK